MNVESVVSDLCSKDTTKIRHAASVVIKNSQVRAQIKALIPYLNVIKLNTKGLVLGGAFAPNQRFVDHSINIIKFHKKAKGCPCCLYLSLDLDPNIEIKSKAVTLHSIEYSDDKWIDYYQVQCNACLKQYKVIERIGHYMWWKWTEFEIQKADTNNYE